MCGITGWIDWKTDLRKVDLPISRMTKRLSHRGPDETGTWFSPHAAFGHSRLIVVDPEGGKQPMEKKIHGKLFCLVYNGELYNTEEIRKDLRQKGYTFQGHSDTEVLLTSYIEWGEACVERFNGIFAFAIWNDKDQKLFIARDRLGVKPLFYYEANGCLIFASELKAILESGNVPAVIDREGVAEVFGLGPSKSPGNGIYKNIKDLRPAHALSYSKNGLKIWRYWNVKSVPHGESKNDTIAHVRELLEDTVKRQLFADVPVATFLSGGLDSSGISAIAAKHLVDNEMGILQTYSIDYEGNEKFFKADTFQPNSDEHFVHLASKHIGSNHQSFVIKNTELMELLKDAVQMRDTPGYADVDSSLLWFCKKIKKDVTVSLSGECADEIFGGYPWYYKPETSAKEGFPWIRSLDARQNLFNDAWDARLNLKEYALSRFQETIAETPRLADENDIEAKRRELFYLNMTWFMTALLDRKDRMSMGASLEVRVPFADHRLVEYVWNIPWTLKMMNGHEKGLLREALKEWLPEDILYRKKSPYPKTHHPEYAKAACQWLESMIEKPSAPLLEIVSKKQLHEIIRTEGRSFQTPWFGQLMTGPQLIAHLAQINYWLETYNVNIES